MTNKEILEKYPFLVKVDFYGRPMREETDMTALDDIPLGWNLLVLQMAEDISKVPHSDQLYFCRIKERYGELRVYTEYSNEEVERIIKHYCFISHNVCVYCGKPDVPMLDKRFWIYPACEDCYCGNKHDYEDLYSEKDCVIPDEYVVRRYSSEGITDITYSIKEIADRYRENWRKKNEKNSNNM